ncbi:hypothetical protein SLEP1_g60240, partial [Rubroshorea leprosula]
MNLELLDQIILPACWTAFCLVGGLACYYYSSRRLLKKRERDEDPSLARLDDQGTSSDPSALAEANPGVSGVPPATHEVVENHLQDMDPGLLNAMSDVFSNSLVIYKILV